VLTRLAISIHFVSATSLWQSKYRSTIGCSSVDVCQQTSERGQWLHGNEQGAMARGEPLADLVK
jgi:hypothetical protein